MSQSSNSSTKIPDQNSLEDKYKDILEWLAFFVPNSPENLFRKHIHTGYTPVFNNDNDQAKRTKSGEVFYAYITNTADNLTNPPLILTNYGGPAVADLIMTTGFSGPFVIEHDLITDKNRVVLNTSNKSLLKLGDMLIADFPPGTGFSPIEKDTAYVSSLDESNKLCAQFLNRLDLEFSKSKKAKIESLDNFTKDTALKDRDIYLYGISFGTALLAGCASELALSGWKIKGLFMDSPVFDLKEMVRAFPGTLKEFQPNYPKYSDAASVKSEECLKLIEQNADKWTEKDGMVCESVFVVEQNIPTKSNIIQKGPDIDVMNMTEWSKRQLDLEFEKLSRTWSDQNSEASINPNIKKDIGTQIFDANPDWPGRFFNQNEYNAMMFNSYPATFHQYYQKVLENGALMSFVVGEVDGQCNINSDLEVFNNMKYFKNSIPNGRKWTSDLFPLNASVEIGSQVWIERVANVGHCVTQRPGHEDLAYDKLQDLMNMVQARDRMATVRTSLKRLLNKLD